MTVAILLQKEKVKKKRRPSATFFQSSAKCFKQNKPADEAKNPGFEL